MIRLAARVVTGVGAALHLLPRRPVCDVCLERVRLPWLHDLIDHPGEGDQ